MKNRSEAKADLAVPEPSNHLELCAKCLDMADPKSPRCGEFDCPFMDVGMITDSDHAVYSNLARANLLRMRGDYPVARELALTVLRGYPGSVTAHTLMGDISTEEGDLEAAREWYELALDLAPDSQVDQQKLDSLRQRITEREAAQTAIQLGLPTSKSGAKKFAFASAVFIVLVGVAFFFLGDWARAKRDAGPTPITSPIVFGEAEASGSRGPELNTLPVVEPVEEPRTEIPKIPNPNAASLPDGTLLETLRSRCLDGSSIVAASEDPRATLLTVTMLAGQDTPVKRLAARVGLSALKSYPDIKRVALRVFVANKLVFVGDVTADSLKAALEGASATEVEALTDPQLEASLSDLWESPAP